MGAHKDDTTKWILTDECAQSDETAKCCTVEEEMHEERRISDRPRIDGLNSDHALHILEGMDDGLGAMKHRYHGRPVN
jgi:hypothetical protein